MALNYEGRGEGFEDTNLVYKTLVFGAVGALLRVDPLEQEGQLRCGMVGDVDLN
jgi:hypothetical protein